MHRLEEMLRIQPVDQIVGQPVVDHHRAEQRGLRLDIAGSCCGSVAAAGF